MKTFRNHRTPKTSLSWDDYYPKSYVYEQTDSIAKLKAKLDGIHKTKT